MSWNYTGPDSSLKDQVRFIVGDTRPKQPFLSDEEITYLLRQHNWDVAITAIQAVEAILSQLARNRDESVGSVSISFSQQYANYSSRLAGLKVKLALDGDILPYAGGISISDKRQAYANPDWPKPDFSRNMMRSPWVVPLLVASPTVDWSQWPLG